MGGNELSVCPFLYGREGVGGNWLHSECLVSKRCVNLAGRSMCADRLSKQLFMISYTEEVAC